MEIILGSTSFEGVPMDRVEPGRYDAVALRAHNKLIYTWYCDQQIGDPIDPPKTVRIDADVMIFDTQSFEWPSPTNPNPTRPIETTTAREHAKRLLELTGLETLGKLQAELDARFPPVVATVPYDKLIEPALTGESRRLYMRETYLRWALIGFEYAIPYPASPFVFQLPIAVEFWVETFAVCDGYIEEAYGWVRHGGVRLPQSKEGNALIRGHAKEKAERDKVIKRF